jgi:hypothetical protein
LFLPSLFSHCCARRLETVRPGCLHAAGCARGDVTYLLLLLLLLVAYVSALDVHDCRQRARGDRWEEEVQIVLGRIVGNRKIKLLA